MKQIAKSRKAIHALINLLEDEDKQVSVAAMERLLSYDKDVDKIIAEFQESSSPTLRGRIHQLGNVVNLKRSRSKFIDDVLSSTISLWDGVLQINYQFNPIMDLHEVRKAFQSLQDRLPKTLTITDLVDFMINEEFTFTSEDILGADLYLVEDVLLQRVGAPILLSVIFCKLAKSRKLSTSIVISNGRHCVHYGKESYLINTSDNWQITKVDKATKIHHCKKIEIWITILCQLFISAIVDGQFQNIHKIGSMLSVLCGEDLEKLPFPLGK